MKKLSLAILAIVLLFTTNITCLAADSETPNIGSSPEVETITIGDDIIITYQTTVIDLNTGTEYHAQTGEPVIIDAVLGHQYSVSATASITPISGVLNALTHFSVGKNGLSINYDFNGHGVRTQAYIFIMPDGARLAYVDESLFSNGEEAFRFSPSWNSATGSKGLETRMYEGRSINDGFILEVTDQSIVTKTPWYQHPIFSVIASVVCVFIGIVIGYRIDHQNY